MIQKYLFKEKKTLMFLVICVLFQFQSCQNDESIIDSKGEISSKIIDDPLFEELDLAFYEVNVNLLTYRNEKIDKVKMSKIREDVKNKKIKSFDDYFSQKEKAGSKDAKKRMLAQIKFNICQEKIFKKYPELKNKKMEFASFFLKNSKHKIPTSEIIQAYKNNTKTNE